MTFPTVHLNGTSAQSLLEDLQRCTDALREARNALREASPNGRDYYVQGLTAHQQAVDEHQVRINFVLAIINELDQIAENIQGQQMVRERMHAPIRGEK